MAESTNSIVWLQKSMCRGSWRRASFGHKDIGSGVDSTLTSFFGDGRAVTLCCVDIQPQITADTNPI
jgi:hypothetical protein